MVTGVFVLSRLAYAAAGIRFDAQALHPVGLSQDQWQMLDVHLLAHHLVQSLWYLNSQPPLENLFCGLLLHLPLGFQQPAAAAFFWMLGLTLACTTYLLILELNAPIWVAIVVALIVVLNPATILYENWLSWSYPAAVLLTAGSYSCARFLRTRRSGWGLAGFTCFAAVVLDDSTFQWPWLIAVLFVTFLAMRPAWRQVVTLSAIPVLLVAGRYAKDAVLFVMDTTSSWVGMNLASTTLSLAPADQLAGLLRQGRIGPIVKDGAFASIDKYDPRFVRVSLSGVPALDARFKSDGATNYNNLVYVDASNEFLHDDVAYITSHPAAYAYNASLGARVWFVPSDQYPLASDNYAGNLSHIADYRKLFDVGVLWQVHQSSLVGFRAATKGAAPSAGVLSYFTIVVYLLAVGLTPLAIYRRRRSPIFAGTMTIMLLTVVYSYASTSLISLGDNMRFQFELGSLPLALAAVTLSALFRTTRDPTTAGSTVPDGRLPQEAT